MAHNLLRDLAAIAPVRITRGNHDCRKKNLKRVDSIKAIVATLGDVDVIYYDKTGFFVDDDVTWAVWHHGEPKNNPWKSKEGKKILINKEQDSQTYIDLFHETVSGSQNQNGLINKSKSFYGKEDFKGDFSFFGHIHKQQYL